MIHNIFKHVLQRASSGSPRLRRPPRPDRRLHRIGSRPISCRKWWSCRRLSGRKTWATRWDGRRCATAIARRGTCRPPLLVEMVQIGPWPSGGECAAAASVAWRRTITWLTVTAMSGVSPAMSLATVSVTAGGSRRPAKLPSAPGRLLLVRPAPWTGLGLLSPSGGLPHTRTGVPLTARSR